MCETSDCHFSGSGTKESILLKSVFNIQKISFNSALSFSAQQRVTRVPERLTRSQFSRCPARPLSCLDSAAHNQIMPCWQQITIGERLACKAQTRNCYSLVTVAKIRPHGVTAPAHVRIGTLANIAQGLCISGLTGVAARTGRGTLPIGSRFNYFISI
jgi:hypothetical protein